MQLRTSDEPKVNGRIVPFRAFVLVNFYSEISEYNFFLFLPEKNTSNE
jgi:hypothetical protein